MLVAEGRSSRTVTPRPFPPDKPSFPRPNQRTEFSNILSESTSNPQTPRCRLTTAKLDGGKSAWISPVEGARVNPLLVLRAAQTARISRGKSREDRTERMAVLAISILPGSNSSSLQFPWIELYGGSERKNRRTMMSCSTSLHQRHPMPMSSVMVSLTMRMLEHSTHTERGRDGPHQGDDQPPATSTHSVRQLPDLPSTSTMSSSQRQRQPTPFSLTGSG